MKFDFDLKQFLKTQAANKRNYKPYQSTFGAMNIRVIESSNQESGPRRGWKDQPMVDFIEFLDQCVEISK